VLTRCGGDSLGVDRSAELLYKEAIKVKFLFKALTTIFVIVITCAGLYAQGALVPPGAPGATMKTLEQLEPRTPISSLPYTIKDSGSYYLTGNLASTTNGIVIHADNVTLDLMGFSLSGDGEVDVDAEIGEYGIYVEGSSGNERYNVVIKGGMVSGFQYGLNGVSMNNSRIEHLVVAGNSSTGVRIDGASSGACNGNTLAHCTISSNGGSGVIINGDQGQCNGNTLDHCTINGNGGNGCYLNGEEGQCNGNTITSCSINGNGFRGINLRGPGGECNGNTIVGCTINGNGGRGINLYATSPSANGGECDGNTIKDNTIRGNEDIGISLVFSDGNRIEGNNISDTTGGEGIGIKTASTRKNFILKNTSTGHVLPYDLDSDDTFGPHVSASGSLTGTNPWANFSR
jgi:parallel beta-helix repeat protein